MTDQSRQIVREVAQRRGIDPKEIMRKCRETRVVYARIEVAKRLDQLSYTTSQIGKALKQDHTTIVYYLGRAKKKPKPEPEVLPMPKRMRKWRAPRVRHVRWLVRQGPADRDRYLVPYAGADMSEYHWSKRP